MDSACVFHNTSTRFSDGYRFGLGKYETFFSGIIAVKRFSSWSAKLKRNEPVGGEICFDFIYGV